MTVHTKTALGSRRDSVGKTKTLEEMFRPNGKACATLTRVRLDETLRGRGYRQIYFTNVSCNCSMTDYALQGLWEPVRPGSAIVG